MLCWRFTPEYLLAGSASVAVDGLVGFQVGGLLARPLRCPWKPRPAWRLRTRQQVRAGGFGMLFCPWRFCVSWRKVTLKLGCGFTRVSISSPNIAFERDWPISVLFAACGCSGNSRFLPLTPRAMRKPAVCKPVKLRIFRWRKIPCNG